MIKPNCKSRTFTKISAKIAIIFQYQVIYSKKNVNSLIN